MNERNKSALKSMGKSLLIAVVPLLWCLGPPYGQKCMGRTEIPFKGKATAGTIMIGYIVDPHHVHATSVSVGTSSGESAESVVSRLATAVTHSDAIFAKLSRNPEYAEAMRKKMAQGSTLSIMGTLDDYILAGTQTGLGIPKPPLSLSCSYNEEAHTIDVGWVNPPGDCQYDSLRILWRYRSRKDTLGSGGSGAKFIWDTPTSFTIKVPPEVNDLDTDIWIKGLRHEMPMEKMRAKDIPLNDNVVPSNATAIHLTSDGYCQEEMHGIPFFAGVAPSWTAWSTAEKVDKMAFEQGNKYAGVRRYEPVRALLTKPFYQVIKAPPRGIVHGVYRQFLGLTPGHTYRLTACLTTLDMDRVEEDCSFSVHAAVGGMAGKPLTARQMAGLEALPNGQRGPLAGAIAKYTAGKTTHGGFNLVFSDEPLEGRSGSGNITLPSGCDTLVVWVRFGCEDPKGKVGFSGVRLEDISAIEEPKSPADIRRAESVQELELLKWMEKASR